MRYRELTTRELKNAIREVYAWPGGYELLAITSDGAVLCMQCCYENFRSIVWSMRHKCDDGWRVIALTYEAVEVECSREVDEGLVSYCANCNREFGEFGG